MNRYKTYFILLKGNNHETSLRALALLLWIQSADSVPLAANGGTKIQNSVSYE